MFWNISCYTQIISLLVNRVTFGSNAWPCAVVMLWNLTKGFNLTETGSRRMVYSSSIFLWTFSYCLFKCPGYVEDGAKIDIQPVVSRWHANGEKICCHKSGEICCNCWTYSSEDWCYGNVRGSDTRWLVMLTCSSTSLVLFSFIILRKWSSVWIHFDFVMRGTFCRILNWYFLL